MKGKVKDASTHKELPAAIVELKEAHLSVLADDDGEFKFKNIKDGKYTLVVKYVGYDSAVKIITVNEEDLKHEKDEEPELELTIYLQPQAQNLSEVEVKGSYDKETDIASRNSEKNADNVINVISAKAIELSPDITAANVLQRISGVSLERTNQGDGRYAILRGMDQRYNNTLINGDKIPSPDAFNRFVPLDIIPSELLQRIEVAKSLTPDMEGDAIGGTVNIVMKDAPDTTVLMANIFAGYSQLLLDEGYSYFDKSTINKKDPSQLNGTDYIAQPGDFTRDNLIFTTKNFTPGASAGLTYGKRFLSDKFGVILSGTFQNKYTGSDNLFYTTSIDQNNNPFASGVTVRSYSDQQIRTGLNANLDFRLNPSNRIAFTNVYLNLQDVESRLGTDTSLTTFRTGPGTGQVFVLQRSEWNLQGIETATLEGEHNITKNFSLKWKGLYSVATNKMPDQAEVTSDFLINANHEASPQYFDGVNHIWQHNSDRDYSGKLDLNYSPKIFNRVIIFQMGGLYRTKSRENYQNEYTLKPLLDSNNTKPIYTGIENAQWSVYNTGGTPIYGNNNYKANEIVYAYYAEGETNFGLLQVLLGLRVENTDQNYHTNAPNTIAGNSATVIYNDFLPNLQLKYSLTDKQNLRFAVFKSISRPSYFDLVPYDIVGENYDQRGNPYLKHTQATNFDLRYELYPNKRDQLLAGVFYKNIVNPIELAFNLSNIYSPALIPSNFGTANNFGFEFVLIKYFGNFGINTNYTYTDSKISSSKILNDASTGSTYTLDETRPLQGQSKNIANVGLIYSNQPLGLDVQLAYQLTGRRIVELSPFYGLDYYQKNLSLLDFSAQKRIGNHFQLFAKINNLLNSPYEVQINNGLLVEKDSFGINYLLGLSYKL